MVKTMFKRIVQQSFSSFKELNLNEAKIKFCMIWAAFASKTIVYKETKIQLSWREVSIELAKIFNSWYNVDFTTDAFINTYNHTKKLGQDSNYDDIIFTLNNNCDGIFITNQSQISSISKINTFNKINLVTGEIDYFKHRVMGGKPESETQISKEEYERICYGK